MVPVLRVNGHSVEIAAALFLSGSVCQGKGIQHIGRAHRPAIADGHSPHAHLPQGGKKGGNHFQRVAKNPLPEGSKSFPVPRAVFTQQIFRHSSTWQ